APPPVYGSAPRDDPRRPCLAGRGRGKLTRDRGREKSPRRPKGPGPAVRRMNPHSLEVLEYRDALDRVARYAASELGAGAVRSLSASTDDAWSSGEMLPLGEMMRLLTGDEGWGMPAIPDLREALRRLKVEGTVWDAHVLRDAGTLMVSSRTAKRNLR